MEKEYTIWDKLMIKVNIGHLFIWGCGTNFCLHRCENNGDDEDEYEKCDQSHD